MSETSLVPPPAVAVREMTDLSRFFKDVTWTGSIEPDGMGPGSPPMTAIGEGAHTMIQDGLWIVGDYRQDQYLTDGSFILTWELHWVAGWDPSSHQYVATYADNYGRAGIMRGRISGDQLVFESAPGEPIRIRLTWDLIAKDRVTWRNEISVNGGPWTLVEQYDCRAT